MASGNISHNPAGYDDRAIGAEVAVVVIGETPYAEGRGDKSDLSLDAEDIAAVRSLSDRGFKVITVLISGRPMIIDDIWHYSDAVVAAWLPGTEGKGIADILFGDYQPSLSCLPSPVAEASSDSSQASLSFDSFFQFALTLEIT